MNERASEGKQNIVRLLCVNWKDNLGLTSQSLLKHKGDRESSCVSGVRQTTWFKTACRLSMHGHAHIRTHTHTHKRHAEDEYFMCMHRKRNRETSGIHKENRSKYQNMEGFTVRYISIVTAFFTVCIRVKWYGDRVIVFFCCWAI